MTSSPELISRPYAFGRLSDRGWRSFRRAKRFPDVIVGGSLLVAVIGFVLIGPRLLPDPLASTDAFLQSPSAAHPFGTDQLGRDVLARVASGGRQSLLLVLVALIVGLLGGLVLGTIGPYVGGLADRLAVVLIDSLLSFPPIIMAIVVVASLGPGVTHGGIAVGIGWIAYFGRFIRAQVLGLRHATYVQAGKACGSSPWFVIGRHIIPNIRGPLIVVTAYAFADSLLTGAGLGFLGLGPVPPNPEWGSMLGDGRNLLSAAPWLALFPGLLILIACLAANLLADGLQDAMNPRRPS